MLIEFKEERTASKTAFLHVLGYIQYLWLIFWRIIIYPVEKVFFSEKKELKDELDQASKHVPPSQISRNNAHATHGNTSETEKEPDANDMCTFIEVIHNREIPKLHSILKQRTLSESSDDLNNSYNHQSSSGNDSISTQSDDSAKGCVCGEYRSHDRKRSVSFSDYVDKASFVPNQSVSSMRQTLKNKRKKQRRNEKRHHGRRRRNSNSISEYSGDEVMAPEIEDLDAYENRSRCISGENGAENTSKIYTEKDRLRENMTPDASNKQLKHNTPNNISSLGTKKMQTEKEENVKSHCDRTPQGWDTGYNNKTVPAPTAVVEALGVKEIPITSV